MKIKITKEEYNTLIKALSFVIIENDQDYVDYYILRDKLETAKRYSESNKTPRGILKRKKSGDKPQFQT